MAFLYVNTKQIWALETGAWEEAVASLMLASGRGEGFSEEVSQGESSIAQWVLMRSHKGCFLVMASGALTGRRVNLPTPQGRIQPKLGSWESFKFSSCLPPAKQIHLGVCLPSTNAVPVTESSSTPLTFLTNLAFISCTFSEML